MNEAKLSSSNTTSSNIVLKEQLWHFAADAKGKQNPEAQAWKCIHICIASPPTKPTQLLYPPILPSHYLQGSRRLSWTARHEFEYDIFVLTTQKARPSPPPGEDEP